MVPLEHEYKLMGMAPYASGDRVDQAKKIFHSAFQMAGDGWNLASGVPNTLFSYNYWRERLEFTRFDYVCAGLQSFGGGSRRPDVEKFDCPAVFL